jgi:hypothetical protein
MSQSALADRRTTDLLVTGIATAGGVLPLREPIRVKPELADGLVTFEYRPLHIVAYGETRAEAAAAFREELSWCWDFYALAKDETLNRSAQEMKAILLALVRRDDE